MTTQTQTQVLIVGAGIAGMLAATTLRQHGIACALVDKGYYPGGRMASRRIGTGVADHGAQFFTVRTPEFGAWVERWIEAGLVYEWSRGWSSSSLGAVPSDGHARFAVHGGMRRLAQFLAGDLDVRQQTQIVQITAITSGWQAKDDKENVYTARALILTPPVPQSLMLLDAGMVMLPVADRAALEEIRYAPCLAGLFWLNKPARLPEPGAVQQPNATITWVADNQRKGISPQATLVTVHAGPDYSEQLWNKPDWEALVALESGLRRYKDIETHIIESHLHRWRYATPTITHPDACLIAQTPAPLVFAGDAFGGPRVEGAALSGLAAGKVLVAALHKA